MSNKLTLSELQSKLKPDQQLAVEMLIEREYTPVSERKTFEEIAAECNISVKGLYLWRQNPDFLRYSAQVSDRKLDSYRAVADAGLMRLVKGTSLNGLPSVKGLEMYYKLIDRMTNSSEITIHEGNRQPRITDDELAERLRDLNN